MQNNTQLMKATQLHAERYDGTAKVANKTASRWTYKSCNHPQKGKEIKVYAFQQS